MFRPLWKLYLKINGWKIIGGIPDHLKKYIIIVMPHTSNWDFILGLAVRSVLKMDTRYLGKKELFVFPFGFIFRALGGYPVDRKSSSNMVDAVVQIFNKHDRFSIAVAPEGTRGRVDRIKTGFYHIAKECNIPIIMAGLDFKKKEIPFSKPFYPTGDFDLDLKTLLLFYQGIEGKYPDLGIDHLIVKD